MNFEVESMLKNLSTRILDMGSGFYVKEANRWLLAGIMSRSNHVSSKETSTEPQGFTFINVPKYISWIQNTNNEDLLLDTDGYRSLNLYS